MVRLHCYCNANQRAQNWREEFHIDLQMQKINCLELDTGVSLWVNMRVSPILYILRLRLLSFIIDLIVLSLLCIRVELLFDSFCQ